MDVMRPLKLAGGFLAWLAIGMHPKYREPRRRRQMGAKQAKATFQRAHLEMLRQRAREARRRD